MEVFDPESPIDAQVGFRLAFCGEPGHAPVLQALVYHGPGKGYEWVCVPYYVPEDSDCAGSC